VQQVAGKGAHPGAPRDVPRKDTSRSDAENNCDLASGEEAERIKPARRVPNTPNGLSVTPAERIGRWSRPLGAHNHAGTAAGAHERQAGRYRPVPSVEMDG